MTKNGNQRGRQREEKVMSSKEERGRDRGSKEARRGEKVFPWTTLAPVQNVLGVTRIGRSCLHGNTHSPARKPLSTHHLSLRFRPWIRKSRPGDCQRWRGLHGAFGVVSGGLVFYWGAEMVLSLAGHSPSGPPGTHGQQHHYKPSPSAALLTLLPRGRPGPC